jgi:hypothetical protein
VLTRARCASVSVCASVCASVYVSVCVSMNVTPSRYDESGGGGEGDEDVRVRGEDTPPRQGVPWYTRVIHASSLSATPV